MQFALSLDMLYTAFCKNNQWIDKHHEVFFMGLSNSPERAHRPPFTQGFVSHAVGWLHSVSWSELQARATTSFGPQVEQAMHAPERDCADDALS